MSYRQYNLATALCETNVIRINNLLKWSEIALTLREKASEGKSWKTQYHSTKDHDPNEIDHRHNEIIH